MIMSVDMRMNNFGSLYLALLWVFALISSASAVKLLLATDQEECVKTSMYTEEVQARLFHIESKQ
jgi:hypothetical protein